DDRFIGDIDYAVIVLGRTRADEEFPSVVFAEFLTEFDVGTPSGEGFLRGWLAPLFRTESGLHRHVTETDIRRGRRANLDIGAEHVDVLRLGSGFARVRIVVERNAESETIRDIRRPARS